MQGVKYAVDIVLCIDATGSMSPIIGKVKAGALKFHDDLQIVMEEKSKVFDSLRIRIIGFRDYYCDGDKSMEISPFFKLPEEQVKFQQFVNGLIADGGGDEPENGLEALALAIKSDWGTFQGKRRQILVIWTDASAHPLEKGGKPVNYPQDIPKDLNELTDWWEGDKYVNESGKRLIMYTPDAYPWTDIATNWSNIIHVPSKAGKGLADIDYKAILESIANSI